MPLGELSEPIGPESYADEYKVEAASCFNCGHSVEYHDATEDDDFGRCQVRDCDCLYFR